MCGSRARGKQMCGLRAPLKHGPLPQPPLPRPRLPLASLGGDAEPGSSDRAVLECGGGVAAALDTVLDGAVFSSPIAAGADVL